MKLLLDTHIWIWSVAEPKRLSRKTTAALGSARNELWLSPISVWELLLLAERKRVELDRPVERWIQDATGPLRDAPLTREVAIESRNLPASIRDPADRFILATARTYGLTLATGDERLMAVVGVSILANR